MVSAAIAQTPANAMLSTDSDPKEVSDRMNGLDEVKTISSGFANSTRHGIRLTVNINDTRTTVRIRRICRAMPGPTGLTARSELRPNMTTTYQMLLV
jgi:hypothetical protein